MDAGDIFVVNGTIKYLTNPVGQYSNDELLEMYNITDLAVHIWGSDVPGEAYEYYQYLTGDKTPSRMRFDHTNDCQLLTDLFLKVIDGIHLTIRSKITDVLNVVRYYEQ